ncbi:MAG: hypothetical protein AB7O62_00430 [Pirellulales bacterium]
MGAIDHKDCFREVWTGTDAGSITLSGIPVAGSLNAADADLLDARDYYLRIQHADDPAEFQLARYTYTESSNQIDQVAVYRSSNGNAEVTFSAGDKHIGTVTSAEFLNILLTTAILDDDPTLAADSDDLVATQAATKAYADTAASIVAAMIVTDHGGLTGLADDDHTQYAMLAGRGGGQTIYGGTAAGENLTLGSTGHGTKGKVIIGGSTTLVADEVNGRVGIGTASPSYLFHVTSTSTATSGAEFTAQINQTATPGGTSTATNQALSVNLSYTANVDNSTSCTAANIVAQNTGSGTCAFIQAVAFTAFQNGSGTTSNLNGARGQCTISSGTATAARGVFGQIVVSGTGTCTTGYAGYFVAVRSAGTYTTGGGVYSDVSGTLTTGYNFYAAGNDATTAWAFYAATTGIRSYFGGAIEFKTQSSTPANPATSNFNVYVKSGTLAFQYNDAGTIRYLKIALTGTGTTWTHDTTAP